MPYGKSSSGSAMKMSGMKMSNKKMHDKKMDKAMDKSMGNAMSGVPSGGKTMGNLNKLRKAFVLRDSGRKFIDGKEAYEEGFDINKLDKEQQIKFVDTRIKSFLRIKKDYDARQAL